MKTREVKLAIQNGTLLLFKERRRVKGIPVTVVRATGAPGTWIARGMNGKELTVSGRRLFTGEAG